jgi:hypothetical protein
MFVGYSEKGKNFSTAACILSNSRFWHSRQQSHNPLHPAVVAAFKLDDPYDWQQLLLEWPYVAESDKTRLAYTRDERSGEDDRQVLTSLGKYLKRHWPDMSDHIIRDFVAKYATAATFRIEHTTEAIVNAVQNGPASCMQFNEDAEDEREQLDNLGHHPYEVYAPCYGWHVATRREGGRITGRALLMQRDNDEANQKYYVRTYRRKDGESYSQPDDELMQWLNSQGYSHHGAWKGERLAYIATSRRHADSEFIAPYIDGNAQDVDVGSAHTSSGSSKCLHICSGGEWRCTNQDGTAEQQNSCTCEDCGGRIREDDQQSVGYHGDRVVGECCLDQYTHVIGRRGHEYYVPDDEAVGVDGNQYDREWLSDNGIVELEDGDYCSMDDAVCVDGEYYRSDDETIVCDHAGEWQLSNDCVELENGDWALEEDAWECAGSGNWYLTDDDTPVEVDGENYHEDYVPETDAETPTETTKESV